jgi:sec-independent protein translocase protein TatA
MPDVGVPELLIIAVIALLIFGPAKMADVGGALGKSIREFRKASHEDDAPAPAMLASTGGVSAVAAPAAAIEPAVATNAASERVCFCTACGIQNGAEQKSCSNCGAAMTVPSV